MIVGAPVFVGAALGSGDGTGDSVGTLLREGDELGVVGASDREG